MRQFRVALSSVALCNFAASCDPRRIFIDPCCRARKPFAGATGLVRGSIRRAERASQQNFWRMRLAYRAVAALRASVGSARFAPVRASSRTAKRAWGGNGSRCRRAAQAAGCARLSDSSFRRETFAQRARRVRAASHAGRKSACAPERALRGRSERYFGSSERATDDVTRSACRRRRTAPRLIAAGGRARSRSRRHSRRA